jgi:hypothetical protein
MVVGGGGASPDDKIGSDEPVSREAAVAAAATLSNVPKTSILLEDIEGSRFSGVVSGGVDEDGCESRVDTAGSSMIGVAKVVWADCSDNGGGVSVIELGDSTSDRAPSVGRSDWTEDEGLEGRNSDDSLSRVRL